MVDLSQKVLKVKVKEMPHTKNNVIALLSIYFVKKTCFFDVILICLKNGKMEKWKNGKMEKLQSLILLFLLWSFPSFSLAQSWDSSYLVVRTSNVNCFPSVDSVLTYTSTGNSTLNNILASNSVTHYFRNNPYSQTDSFNQTITIIYTGPSASLISQLQATSLFYLIEKQMQTGANAPSLNLCPPGSLSNEPWIDFRKSTVIASDWHLRETDVYCAWDITMGDPNVKVALIDIGFDPNHYDLGNIIHKKVGNPNHLPDVTHASGTSSIIAASHNDKGIVGAAPSLSTSVYEIDSLTASFVERAIAEAVNDGVKVINMSFDELIHDLRKWEEWIAQGVLFVASAGNDLGDRNWTEHSELRGFILVSGTEEGSLYFSSHAANEFVDICAPGAKIWQCTQEESWGSLLEAYGTSSAAPQVAAAAGLMLSVNPNLSPAELECGLKSTTDPILNDVPGEVWYGKVGTGRLNTHKAVQFAQALTLAGSIPTVINSQLTITGSHYVPATITIADGGLLILQNATIQFAENVGINVSPGGILNIAGSDLTSSIGCEYFWQGIKVSGNGFTLPRKEGRVTINNSEINGALVGVRISNHLWFAAGGSVGAKNSQFINCPTGVEHTGNAFKRDLHTWFSGCTFEWTKPYAFTGSVNHHIKLSNTYNFSVYSSSFLNRMPKNSFNEIAGRGVGVSNYNSDMEVMPIRDLMNPCNVTGTNCIFEGLEKGIVSNQSNIDQVYSDNEKKTRVYNCSFKNNKYNIDLYQDKMSVIFENNFLWDEDFAMYHQPSISNIEVFYAILNTESKGAQLLNNTISMEDNNNVIDYFIGDFHINDERGGLFKQVGSISHSYRNVTAQNEYNSSDLNLRVIGNFFDNYIPSSGFLNTSANLACNQYSETLFRGSYFSPDSKVSGSLGLNLVNLNDPNGFGASYAGESDYSTCQNALGSGITHLSIDNQSGINLTFKYHYPSEDIDPLCLNNVQPISTLLLPHPNCAAGDYFFSPNGVYCPGLDGAPGTDDQYEGTALIVDGVIYYGDGQTGGGVGDGVANADNDHNGDNELIETLGYSLTDLYEGNTDLREDLKALFATENPEYLKTVQLHLSHFYGVYVKMPSIEIEENNTQMSSPSQDKGDNIDELLGESLKLNTLSPSTYSISSTDPSWQLVYTTDYLGKQMDITYVKQTAGIIQINGVAPGVYMLHLQNNMGNVRTLKLMVH